MEFLDRILSCVDCGAEFTWTAGEQLFFADKNFKNEPKRCKSCKAKRATAGGSMGREGSNRYDRSECARRPPCRSSPPGASCLLKNASLRSLPGGGVYNRRIVRLRAAQPGTMQRLPNAAHL